MREYGGRVSIPTPDTRTYPSIDELTSKRRKSIRVVVPSIVDSLPVYPIFLSSLKRHLGFQSYQLRPRIQLNSFLPSWTETVNTIPQFPARSRKKSLLTKQNRIIARVKEIARPKLAPTDCIAVIGLPKTMHHSRQLVLSDTSTASKTDRNQEPWAIVIQPNGANLRIYPSGCFWPGGIDRIYARPHGVCEGTGEGAKEVAAIGYRTCLDACVAARASQHRIRPRLILDARRWVALHDREPRNRAIIPPPPPAAVTIDGHTGLCR